MSAKSDVRLIPLNSRACASAVAGFHNDRFMLYSGAMPEAPRIDELREALLQRAENWRVTLRAEPQVARTLVRRLIGAVGALRREHAPQLHQGGGEVKHSLLDGIVPHAAYNGVASAGKTREMCTGVASLTGTDGLYEVRAVEWFAA
jgi:hypothetical protein